MKRTALLLVLLMAYGGMLGRRLITGTGEAFDPVAPQAREIERALADKQYERVIPLVKELQTQNPDEPLAQLWLADAYRGLRRFADEANAWERFIEIGSAPEEACPRIASAYSGGGGDAPINLAAVERCAKLDPRDPERLVAFAGALYIADRLDEALAVYRRAAAMDPRNPAIARQVEQLSQRLAGKQR